MLSKCIEFLEKAFKFARIKVVKLLSNECFDSESYKGIEKNVKFITDNGSIQIGKRVTIMSGSYLSSIENGKIEISSAVFINRNFTAVSRGEIILGEGTSIGPNVCMYDHDHYFGRNRHMKGFNVGRITVGNNCWIGNGVIILKNTDIGDNCVIGAGCVISGTIPPNTLVKNGGTLLSIPIDD